MSGMDRTATVEELLQMLSAKDTQLREKDEQIRSLSADLLKAHEEIALLRHKIFGRMSEKLTGEDETQGRFSLMKRSPPSTR